MADVLRGVRNVYAPGPWKREPYPLTPLQPLGACELAPDCGEARDAAALPAKLRVSLTARQAAAAAAAGTGESVPVLDQLPSGLQAWEVDVRPTWGVDSFTRTVLWETLGQCPQLGAPGSARLDDARTRFLEQHLLPALNKQGNNGW